MIVYAWKFHSDCHHVVHLFPYHEDPSIFNDQYQLINRIFSNLAVRSPSPVKKPIQLDAQRPTADVEPILRSNSLMHEIDSDRSQLDLLDAASVSKVKSLNLN